MLMPTKLPSVFTRAPPLLPGFTAASVWINASRGNTSLYGSLFRILMFLDLALTIPAVTVYVKLNGFPTANTHSPIFT